MYLPIKEMLQNCKNIQICVKEHYFADSIHRYYLQQSLLEAKLLLTMEMLIIKMGG